MSVEEVIGWIFLCLVIQIIRLVVWAFGGNKKRSIDGSFSYYLSDNCDEGDEGGGCDGGGE